MHELSIAQKIIETAEAELNKQKASNIKKIYISVGILSGVSTEALDYSFATLIKTTPHHNCKLITVETPLKIKCKNCDEITTFETQAELELKCKSCGQSSSNIICGKELKIDKIEINYD